MIKYLLILTFFSSYCFGEMPKERRLKKLSMHLNGQNPSATDYKELEKAQDTQAFFEAKTDEYLSNPRHFEKMNLRLSQLFRLGLAEYIGSFNRNEKNSLNSMFKDISKNNLSWNSLLTGKKYKLYMSSMGFSGNDFGYFGAVLPFKDYPRVERGVLNNSDTILQTKTLETNEEVYGEFSRVHQFESSDMRVAGALTTDRFFQRNVNTGVNKNRKRAASVFRIFLCDDMEAAITSSEDRSDYILDFVFPDTAGMSSTDTTSISLAESAHGQSADCMACHYKLDPLGKTFGGSGNSLAPTAFSGALTYRASNGESVNLPVSGLGELAANIVEQKDYKLCQTKQFWKWFIGEDKYLEEDVHEELVENFDKVDGRVNDFISYMVNRKEFYSITTLSSEAKLAFKVKGTLKNCNQCHDNEGLPSFTKWPIQDSKGDMSHWVGKIGKSLGIGTSERTMPPKEHIWQPSKQDIDDINEWIRIGAPNEQGNRQIP